MYIVYWFLPSFSDVLTFDSCLLHYCVFDLHLKIFNIYKYAFICIVLSENVKLHLFIIYRILSSTIY